MRITHNINHISTYKDYRILFKITSRERPEKLEALIKNLHQMLSDNPNYIVLISIDKDDPTLSLYEEVTGLTCVQLWYFEGRHWIRYGLSKNKVDAINRDVAELTYDWDILVNLSDDQEIMVQGFDDIIRKIFYTYFPDTDGCPCLWDGYRQDRLITCAVLGRRYYNRTGKIYNTAYNSYQCDNHQTAEAMILNRFLFWKQVLIQHNHPDNTGRMEDNDQLYQKNLKTYWETDTATFEQMRENDFYIPKQKILSYCLWGNKPKYIQGMYKNIELAKNMYPEWTVRVYVNHLDIRIIAKLYKIGAEISAIPKATDNYLMLARFYPASEKYVEIMASRDADSRISARERDAVGEFEQSLKMFHCMHDHPNHHIPIMGGMFAVKYPMVWNMKEIIREHFQEIGSRYQCDQYILHAYVYPLVKDKMMIHADHVYYEHKQPQYKFKTPPATINDFVGASYDIDEEGNDKLEIYYKK